MQNLKVEKDFKIGCRADEISPLLEKVFSELDKSVKNSSEIMFKLELAAREMLANAIEHGCALAAENDEDLKNLSIGIKLIIGADELIFKVEDPGPGFDWKNYDLEKMPKFEEKGRGLKMINKVSDQIEFNSSGNKITAVFKL
jgi:serine/threonine-protein kinase RsbW